MFLRSIYFDWFGSRDHTLVDFMYLACGTPPSLHLHEIDLLVKQEKAPLTYFMSKELRSKQKTPLTEQYTLSRTNRNNTIRGATLIHGATRALCRIPTYPGNWRMPTRCRILWEKPHLTAPSAAHLTTCFLPDFQHHRLSVKSSLPLSPLQRFERSNWFTL